MHDALHWNILGQDIQQLVNDLKKLFYILEPKVFINIAACLTLKYFLSMNIFFFFGEIVVEKSLIN
jgi:hypothetical protein